MNTISFLLSPSPSETGRKIAERLREIRKKKKLSQQRLSEKSGVSLGSLKRFEQSGEISLISLIKLASALDVQGELDRLFCDIPPSSIEEIIHGENKKIKRTLW